MKTVVITVFIKCVIDKKGNVLMLVKKASSKYKKGPNHRAGEDFSSPPTRPGSGRSTSGGMEAGVWDPGGGDGACDLGVGGCWLGSKCA